MQNILTPHVLHLIDLLDGRARIVGGAVRDRLSNIPVHDIDLATELSPHEVVTRLQRAGIRLNTTGMKHGTIMAIIDRIPYEITTLRQDIDTNGRHATVAFTNSYELDAQRRDFTINALYMDKNGTLYDYVGGRQDLEHKLVRFIGNASDRVQEDYLRILRYFRFWGKMGCHAVDKEAITACQTHMDGLKNISGERKREEIFRILRLPTCVQVLTLMQHYGILSYIIPTAHLTALERLLSVFPSAELEERLAVLTNTTKDLPELSLSRSQTKLITDLIKPYTCQNNLPQERLSLYQVGERVYRFYVYRALSNKKIPLSLANRLLSLQKPTFPVRGQDFINLGFSAGKSIQTYLDTTQRLWAENGFSDNKELVLDLFLVYNKKKR